MKKIVKAIFIIVFLILILLCGQVKAAIEPEEMDNEYISIKKYDSTPFNYVGDNQYLVKDKDDNGNFILHIAEKKEISDDTYETAINAINLMFGSEATDYFKKGCPKFDKDVTIDGFKIEINPERTEIEKGVFNNENFFQYEALVRITIDPEKLSEHIGINVLTDTNNTTNTLKTSNDEENKVSSESKVIATNTVSSTNTEKNVANINVMPRTGEERNQTLSLLYILILVSSLEIFCLVITRKK